MVFCVCFIQKMTVGSIIHELLQIVLQRKLTTLSDIKSVTEELLMSQQMAFTLYACQMTSAEAFEEVIKFQEKIVDFVDKYLTGSKAVNGKKVRILCVCFISIQKIHRKFGSRALCLL